MKMATMAGCSLCCLTPNAATVLCTRQVKSSSSFSSCEYGCNCDGFLSAAADFTHRILAVASSSRLDCNDTITNGICIAVSLQARGSESLQDVARLFGLSAARVLADNQGVITEANQALGGRSILLCGQHGERHVSTLGVNEYMHAQCVRLVCSSQGSKCGRNMQWFVVHHERHVQA